MAQKMTWLLLLLPQEMLISPKWFLHFLCNLSCPSRWDVELISECISNKNGIAKSAQQVPPSLLPPPAKVRAPQRQPSPASSKASITLLSPPALLGLGGCPKPSKVFC